METKQKKYNGWNYLDEIYYLCKVCGGRYLLENYDFKKHKCKKCLLRDKIKNKTKIN